jgi:hypothetical protein
MNKPSQWRSVLVVMFLAAVLLAGLSLAITKSNEQVVKLYDSFSTGLWIMALGLLGKSVGQYAAGGGGLKGMASALLTESKPGEPPAPAAPAVGAPP